MRTLTALYLLICGYYGAELCMFWMPLAAVLRSRRLELLPDPPESDEKPFIFIIVPCRHASGTIPGLANNLKKLDYPSDRYRVIVLIDSDDHSDPSAYVTRSLGLQVYERINAPIKTKGASINDLLDKCLKHERFDALLIMDIDCRLESDFLRRVQAHLRQGELVVQGDPLSKNPNDNTLTRLGDAAQGLTRVTSRGRAAMGFPVHLLGPGMVLSRAALSRLNWQVCSGRHITEDIELNLRCYLNNLWVHYGPDLKLLIDLPEQPHVLRRQRRRWSGGALELIVLYFWPLLRKALSGDVWALEAVFSLLLLPPLSILFVAGGLMAFSLTLLSFPYPHLRIWAEILIVMWISHGLYYIFGLKAARCALTWRDTKGVLIYLSMRVLALAEGVILACRIKSGSRWVPTPHKEDS